MRQKTPVDGDGPARERDRLAHGLALRRGLLVADLGPLVYSVVLSFTQWDLLTPVKWIGLHNYRDLAAAPETLAALRVTGVYAATSIPLRIVLGLVVAVLLKRPPSVPAPGGEVEHTA